MWTWKKCTLSLLANTAVTLLAVAFCSLESCSTATFSKKIPQLYYALGYAVIIKLDQITRRSFSGHFNFIQNKWLLIFFSKHMLLFPFMNF